VSLLIGDEERNIGLAGSVWGATVCAENGLKIGQKWLAEGESSKEVVFVSR
jgi:hypothetical protein